MTIKDFHAWTEQQADALRRRAANEIDWDNLLEEIETLGRSERHEITSRLKILLLHLLKWRFQPDAGRAADEPPNRWRASIFEARSRIAELIDESPSLQPHLRDQFAKVYPVARKLAQIEMGGLTLADLPEACPWSIEDVLNEDFLPGEERR